ncbi:MAG: hypothetical protein ACOH2R_19650 [Pseudomonas sp.]
MTTRNRQTADKSNSWVAVKKFTKKKLILLFFVALAPTQSWAAISVFQVSSSNPGKPTGYCGAGNEVWLYVYKVEGSALIAHERVLVSSCLRSISPASQNTRDEAQDVDFSSVQWNTQGFSIDWFSHVDASGKPLKTTNYVLRGEHFAAQEILEAPGK